MAPRIVIAGFLHETNTFAATPADYENFVNGEGFPRMRRGGDVLGLADVNIAAGGFIKEARGWEADLRPVLWCAASPSAPVTDRAFERICGEVVEACRDLRPDAVYLDLHGAMVTRSHDDGDGEVLRRVREAVGPRVPVVVSLDLHANMTRRMFDEADAMVAYRTYPHVDMAETGRRAASLLRRLLDGAALTGHHLRIPFLVPINSGSTLLEPAGEVYDHVQSVPDDDVTLTFAAGFPAADFPDCGPSVFGYGEDADAVVREVERLRDLVERREDEFALDVMDAEQAVDTAIRTVESGVSPVVVADTQDNPGAGGDARTTGLLRVLLERDHPGSVLAAMWDADVVAQAARAGAGGRIEAEFPGSGVDGDAPLRRTFEVAALTDGRVVFEGPMMRGNELAVGPSCLLRSGNVSVVVSSRKAQIMDRNQIRAAGIEPEAQNIVVVKSSVHFRGDFQPMAGRVLVGVAPGPMAADPTTLPWTRLRSGMRTGPDGPAAP
ncbi:microcystin degradation protein MlrC [Spinactinospora alkalitolerans]|uniref:Microcystin degradation protein MlrC n=1 Tax=Spinactinospora alkalitolerans TaxID=687207 RepID=A0A852TWX7_9ACTN|nr:M81 family metallopeptidase [Spinactinospora alkalitolerans]NYE47885.1 microcystin degradation protein MlrC [Spinactinospora alkalitolerans]